MVVVSLLLVVGLPAPAFGWANGSGGCDSFGGHDWILKKAIRATEGGWGSRLGPDARRASLYRRPRLQGRHRSRVEPLVARLGVPPSVDPRSLAAPRAAGSGFARKVGIP